MMWSSCYGDATGLKTPDHISINNSDVGSGGSGGSCSYNKSGQLLTSNQTKLN